MADNPQGKSSNGSTPQEREMQRMLNDEEDRGCNVIVYTEPLSGKNSAKTVVVDSSASTRHWFLVFQFEDGKYITCELRNPAGSLCGGPIEVVCAFLELSRFNNSTLKPYKLGETVISPKKLCNVASTLPMNTETYHAVKRNCHNWVLQFLSILDPALYQKAINGDLKLKPLDQTYFRGSTVNSMIASNASRQPLVTTAVENPEDKPLFDEDENQNELV